MTEKDKKEIKGYMKKLSDDFGKQIGVYIEDVNDRFKALGEGTATTNEKLDRIEKTLDSHTEQIADLMMNMEVVKSDVKELRADMLGVKSDVKQTKLDVRFNLDQKIDKKHFVDLEGRIRILEKK